MKHGGDLSAAHAHYGGTGRAWLDLSTGIAPTPYPFTPPPPQAWQCLPQARAIERLIATARQAYEAPATAQIVAAPGTQLLIQLLPSLLPGANVCIAGPTYSEHATCWRRTAAQVAIAKSSARMRF